MALFIVLALVVGIQAVPMADDTQTRRWWLSPTGTRLERGR